MLRLCEAEVATPKQVLGKIACVLGAWNALGHLGLHRHPRQQTDWAWVEAFHSRKKVTENESGAEQRSRRVLVGWNSGSLVRTNA
jgi:hypothetical protein